MSDLALYLLHLVAGVVWTGGVLYNGLILYPSLARRPAAEAKAALTALAARASSIVGAAGVLVLISGPWRAWQSGAIRSPGDLMHGYGLVVLVAFLLAFFIPGIEGSLRAKLRRLMDRPEDWTREAPGIARRIAVVVTLGFGAILVLMAMLGTGSY